jgi:hypothetical protein
MIVKLGLIYFPYYWGRKKKDWKSVINTLLLFGVVCYIEVGRE